MPGIRSNGISLLITLLIVAGCGGAAAPPATGQTRTAAPPASAPAPTSAGAGGGDLGERLCSLVPADVVAGAMGQEVTDTYNANEDACDWDLDSGSSIQFRYSGGADALQSLRDTFPGGQDVAGIGDEAYHEGSQLNFRKGDATYTVQLVLMGGEMTDAEKLEVLRPIALAALQAGL